MNTAIHIDTREEKEAVIKQFVAEQLKLKSERRKAAHGAMPALARLCEVMKGRSGQPYHLRRILFSLYSGKPAPFVNIVHFDWEIRKDLAAVLLAFGFEDPEVKMFYDAIRLAVKASGQWDWFEQEADEVDYLREWVNSYDSREGK